MSKRSLKNSAEPRNSLEQPWEQAIRAVSEERSNPKSAVSLFDLNFPQQTGFISDPAKRKGLWCTRRAAKSYTAGLYLCDVAERFHEVNCLYLGLTKDSAMGIIWKDILIKIDRKHELGMYPRESKRDMTSKTGSLITISGADADSDEMSKLLGRKYKLIIIDEAQSFSVDMRTLVYGILGPTLVDEGGTMCLMGTSGNLTKGLFYDITTGKEPGWKLFQWTAHDNPYVAKKWQEELDDIEKTRPLFKETSLFKQWYLNQWVIDEDAIVYKFRPDRNRALALPIDLSDWHYVLGVDLAHSPDSTAFVVGCYHEADPKLYLVSAHKQTKMDLTAVAARVHELHARYAFEVKVCDGANKQAVAELNNRHGLGLIPADKTAKADFIKVMNDDFIQGLIVLLPDTKALYNPKAVSDPNEEKGEYEELIWITDEANKVIEPRKENQAIHNDCSDAALYLWRHCYQWLHQPRQPKPDPNSQAVWEKAHMEKLAQQVRQEKNPNELELNWVESWDHQEDDLP